MAFAKNITTLILALLLANPACCCALSGSCSPEKTPEKAPVRSCCSGSAEDTEEKDAPKEDHQCMCSLNTDYTEHVKFQIVDPQFSILPDPPVVILDADLSVPPSIYSNLPHAERPPPGPSIRILYSVFRL